MAVKWSKKIAIEHLQQLKNPFKEMMAKSNGQGRLPPASLGALVNRARDNKRR